MTGMDLFRAMDGLDPAFLAEAAPDAPRRTGRRGTVTRRLCAIAAALCAAVTVILLLPRLWRQPETPEKGEAGNDVTREESGYTEMQRLTEAEAVSECEREMQTESDTGGGTEA